MPLRFLLVDDDDVDREVVSRLLSRIDPSFELVEAVNITDARESSKTGSSTASCSTIIWAARAGSTSCPSWPRTGPRSAR
jgi:CheY-like chemotaxis protein